MTQIESVHAREVFDSRARPTVEVEVACANGARGRAIAPSGASTGRFEARELRDADDPRLEGGGVRRAVENVRREISGALRGLDPGDQRAVDHRLCELDGTADKSRLGGNALIGTSLAVARAGAAAREASLVDHLRALWVGALEETGETPACGSLGTEALLPLPMVNMISGGLHAGGNLDVQDVLALPVGAQSFSEGLDWIVTVYRSLGRVLSERGYEGRLVGDEGGYGPRLQENEEALQLVVRAVERAGLVPGRDVVLGLDVAASHFFEEGGYSLHATGGGRLSAADVVDLLSGWVDAAPVASIEDGLDEDDWAGWKRLTERLGDRVQLIGDDLFVTNRERLLRGIREGVANAILVKPNQIGTLWETLETLRTALAHGYRPIVSARSGETEDDTIADLAVATGAGQIKIGSVVRSERLAKYNQLLRIEERGVARYVGREALTGGS